MTAPGLTRRGLDRLSGPFAFVRGVPGAALHELVEIEDHTGSRRSGRLVAIHDDTAVIEVFGPTSGLELSESSVRFIGETLTAGVGPEALGRVLDALGRPRDGRPPPLAIDRRPVEGAPINPTRRECPRAFLETGFSAVDALNTLTLGQKLPIFTEAGLPHDRMARDILRHARAPGVRQFALIFIGLGLPRDVAADYEETFYGSDARQRTTMVLSLADESATERLIAPRTGLTLAEYLAFDLGMHVLVVMTDMTNYGEALREVAAGRGEIPSRKGYPGYLYSDLASIFERAGRIAGLPGSLTQLPIVSLPAGDMTHPIPDLTGYVTEGQIVLDRRLHARGVYPPVAVLSSLSRLMRGGIGEGRTRGDHAALSGVLYAGCANVERARALEAIVGRAELTEDEQDYLRFGERFELEFVSQPGGRPRSITETLDCGWRVARLLPEADLSRLDPAVRARHLSAAETAA
ncbi:MAG TPA: V-type ATP synthase subunit B [Vicinamibacterales bacterium]|nr:V-type ATP synthase subunit B [Vicinamibacterales bacterium]